LRDIPELTISSREMIPNRIQTRNPKPEPEPEPEPKPVPDAYTPFTTDILGHAGISYIWDENVIPEITVKMSVEEWNNFLAAYDQRPSNKDYFHCDITYKKGIDVNTITDAGIRLRGNTSRRRPEGWTGVHDVYCRLWLTVGDGNPAYFGVYEMIEPIDDEYIERRVDGMIESKKGFLWKCLYGEGGMADLRSADDWRFRLDQNDGHNYTYEFREMYKNALMELIDPANGLLDMDASIARIENWQSTIRDYVSNDTGEDMNIYDQPAFWGTHPEYRLLDRGSNNFFKVKAESIRSME